MYPGGVVQARGRMAPAALWVSAAPGGAAKIVGSSRRGGFPTPEPCMTSSSPAKAPRARAGAEVAPSYEAALQELEQLVAQLDAGQLPLDQLLVRYQRGAELLAFCRARLDAVDQQIKVLEAGELKPWDGA